MQVQQIIGADLSKKTIDLASYSTGKCIEIENSLSGFKQFVKWLKSQNIKDSEAKIVMEHTGLYSYCFEEFLHQQSIPFVKVSALEIKRSMGLVRGKSDKIDAKRIAQYGYEKSNQLPNQKKVDKGLNRLQMLQSLRSKLVKQRAGLVCTIKELKNVGIPASDLLLKSQLLLVSAYDKQIKKVEAASDTIFEKDACLKKNYQLLQGIKGVGKVLASKAIIKTQNFTRFQNARKFACFCGTAPFEHTSGTSIKGRTRVSHLADKEMKSLLDLSAKCAIVYDPELREFYQRRLVLGKSKMSTINIVRNKILYRMFAVIKRQSPFVVNYLQVA